MVPAQVWAAVKQPRWVAAAAEVVSAFAALADAVAVPP